MPCFSVGWAEPYRTIIPTTRAAASLRPVLHSHAAPTRPNSHFPGETTRRCMLRGMPVTRPAWTSRRRWTAVRGRGGRYSSAPQHPSSSSRPACLPACAPLVLLEHGAFHCCCPSLAPVAGGCFYTNCFGWFQVATGSTVELYCSDEYAAAPSVAEEWAVSGLPAPEAAAGADPLDGTAAGPAPAPALFG